MVRGAFPYSQVPCFLACSWDFMIHSHVLRWSNIIRQPDRRTMFQYQWMDDLQHNLEKYVYVNLFSVNQQVCGWVGWIRVGITAPLSLCFSCHWNARRSEQSSHCLKLKHAISTFKTFWCSTADKDANNPDSENEDKKFGNVWKVLRQTEQRRCRQADAEIGPRRTGWCPAEDSTLV